MLEPQEYIRKYGIEKAREYYELIKNKPLYSFNADMPRKYKEMIEWYEIGNLFMGSFDPEKQTALMNKMFENKKDWIGDDLDNVDLENLK